MQPVFPDAEALYRKYLADALEGVRVATLVPNPRPAEFIRAWRTGGTAMNRVVDRAQITVQVWAESTVAASGLANRARHLSLEAAGGMPLVRGVTETSGVYADPDPATGSPRYTFTHELTIRARRA